MFLEAQFGPAVTPITHPKLPATTVLPMPESSPSAQSLQAEGRSPQPENKVKGEKVDVVSLHSFLTPVLYAD